MLEGMLETIKQLCKERDIGFATLERELGFGAGSVRRWGVSPPSIDRVAKVAEYFGVTLDFLFYGKTKKAHPINEMSREDMIMKIVAIFNSLGPEDKKFALGLLDTIRQVPRADT
jgi:transcriptional regulator with XRE-family HTH domain